jgi:hypothetical protein
MQADYLQDAKRPHNPVQGQVVGGGRLVLAACIQPHGSPPCINDWAAAGAALGARRRLQIDCSRLIDPESNRAEPGPHGVKNGPQLRKLLASVPTVRGAHVLKSLKPLCEYCGASRSRRASVPDKIDSCNITRDGVADDAEQNALAVDA